jgi:hypothetical protein
MNSPSMVQLGPKLVPMLTMRDMTVLSERYYMLKRSELISGLAEAAVCDSERVAALKSLSDERGSFSQLFRWAATADGAVAIIEMACAKHGVSVDEVMSNRVDDVVSLAISLVLPPSKGGAEGNAVMAENR